jgi:hypothetical protein
MHSYAISPNSTQLHPKVLAISDRKIVFTNSSSPVSNYKSSKIPFSSSASRDGDATDAKYINNRVFAGNLTSSVFS